jgi:alkylhydroperoxidase/carboxymuconolactone decarboxylase family protein YurZ
MKNGFEISSAPRSETGPWETVATELVEWDPAWAAACIRMTTNPWVDGVLPRKFVELVGVAVNAACTNLNPEGTRRHIRAALQSGATRDEVLTVLKMASVMSIHSCSLGAPILLEEAKAAGAKPAAKSAAPTPACDEMRSIGQWNTAWDPFFTLDPVWTDAFMATGAGIYRSGTFTPKEVELLSIAFDASYTHMYAPGTRRHIKGALAAGATMEEIMEVLKLCVVQGVQSCNLGVPILAEELERLKPGDASSSTKKKLAAEGLIDLICLTRQGLGREIGQ